MIIDGTPLIKDIKKDAIEVTIRNRRKYVRTPEGSYSTSIEEMFEIMRAYPFREITFYDCNKFSRVDYPQLMKILEEKENCKDSSLLGRIIKNGGLFKYIEILKGRISDK